MDEGKQLSRLDYHLEPGSQWCVRGHSWSGAGETEGETRVRFRAGGQLSC